MFLNHCVGLLLEGRSSVDPQSFDDLNKIVFKLQTGVTAKRLDSIKTSLLMIEAVKLSYDSKSVATFDLFENLVQYAYRKHCEPIAMALVKYALADRRINVRNVKDAPSWDKIKKSFAPSLLNDSQDPKDLKLDRRYKKCYTRVQRCKNVSQDLNEYLRGELASKHEEGAARLSAALV